MIKFVVWCQGEFAEVTIRGLTNCPLHRKPVTANVTGSVRRCGAFARQKTTGMERKIAIVDDHVGVSDGIKLALEKYAPDIQVVAAPTCGRELLDFLNASTVDLVVLDLNLPDADGMQLCKTITKHNPDLLVLIYSMDESVQTMKQSLQNGAFSYISKTTEGGLRPVVDAIEGAFHGRPVFLGLIDGDPSAVKLTDKEITLLRVYARGVTEPEQVANGVAKLEGTRVERHTVRKRKQRIAAKLNVPGDTEPAELIRIARQQKINIIP